MLQLPTKAGGIAHLTDARYFAAWYVDYLGFSWGGTNGVNGPELAAMLEWVTGARVLVELQGAALPDAVLEDLFAAGLLAEGEKRAIHGLQWPIESTTFALAGNLVPAEVHTRLQAHDLQLWFRLPVAHHLDSDDLLAGIDELLPYCDALLLDFSQGGLSWSELENGQPLPLDALLQRAETNNIYLDLPTTPDQLQRWIAQYPRLGLVLQGSAEEQVGYKSFEELDEVFDQLAL